MAACTVGRRWVLANNHLDEVADCGVSYCHPSEISLAMTSPHAARQNESVQQAAERIVLDFMTKLDAPVLPRLDTQHRDWLRQSITTALAEARREGKCEGLGEAIAARRRHSGGEMPDALMLVVVVVVCFCVWWYAQAWKEL